MSKTCSSCGAESQAEARFCRRCGAPLRTNSADDNSQLVSPLAATVPLSDIGRATDSLSPEDPRRSGPETTRVNRAELDSLLRANNNNSAPPSQSLDATGHPFDPQRTSAQLGQQTNLDEHFGQQTLYDPALQTPDATQSLPPQTEGLQTSDLSNKLIPANGEGSNAHRDSSDGNHDDDDEELTITVARVPPPHIFRGDEQAARVVPSGVHAASGALPHAAAGQAQAPPPPPESPAPPAGQARKLWYVAAAASLLLLAMTCVAVWLGIGYFRKQPSASLSNVTPTPADSRQLFDEKLAEAESLLAKGDLDAAINALRQATALDPANTKARRRLGDLLLDNGRRREAIEEFRAITRIDARDAEGWRSLARAQLDESLYEDASESFRRLIALGGEASLNDNELLSYAEALRLSGLTDEARPFYERLASSAFADVANSARQHLSELASASATPNVTPTPEPAQANQNRQQQVGLSPTPSAMQTAAAASPTPARVAANAPPNVQTPPQSALSASEHFARGEQLWGSNRVAALGEFRAAAAAGNADAHYYLGLALLQGREPSALQRAEIGAALQHFQNAQRGGRFRAQAQRYEEQLGKEFDRRRQK
ncbi:MAG TPA: tetratricopeptide repeat protein [Pyrinomonadaceae bacterium]|nr:tetratricopeptide repeat protein [Pyrinomonadaceae bacterium]